MAGDREKKWGKEVMFREGQSKQVLDDLFFSLINTVELLKPKVVIAENVKGMIQGDARGYVTSVVEKLNDLDYKVQVFLLNSVRMGVPQARERVFFIARRNDLGLKDLSLSFNEKKIPLYKAFKNLPDEEKKYLKKGSLSERYWYICPPGKSFSTVARKGWFSNRGLSMKKPSCTLTANCGANIYHPEEPRYLTKTEVCRISTFPDDYDFMDLSPHYVCGMSVPPFMMNRIVNQVISQWKIK